MNLVVILGCAFKNGNVTDELEGRVNVGLEYARLVKARYVIFSGGFTSKDKHTSESRAMLEIALKLDNNFSDLIIVEEKSKTTIENAVYSREIIESKKMKCNIHIITSCYHIS